ncbi:MAG: penicillin acylase family protein [Anaerolineae bacterium]|nr:penicillin acylase family protein [Anaerolineae bacterium]
MMKILESLLLSLISHLDRRALPQKEGQQNVPGLRAPVKIVHDRWGIPHIYAQNQEDLFFAQGFVHAQDRLWQMELHRRIATGRLSELLGPRTLLEDRITRTLGFYRLALQDWDKLDETIHRILLAYTRGVNSWLQHSSKKPAEFTLLQHAPEPWTPLDSLAFARLVVWQLSSGWYHELIRQQLYERVGAQRGASWDIFPPEKVPPTLPRGIEVNLPPKQRSSLIWQGLGSNAWVLSPSKTRQGPLLCNDTHLPLMAPSLWYENHLVSEDGFQVTGVSLPGIPLVMVGHNANIAWGITLGFADCEDLFYENTFLFSPEEGTLLEEAIRVRGKRAPFIEPVFLGPHGPIISNTLVTEHPPLALCATALKEPIPLKGWYLLNTAENWQAFSTALQHIKAPSLNILYADKAGNIGYRLAGAVPLRTHGDGSLPVPGWKGKYHWQGEIPFEEMPHALNPQQGFIVSCNQQPISSDYPYFLGRTWMNGYRALRATHCIQNKDSLSIKDCAKLQLDYHCLPGPELARHFASLTGLTARESQALQLLLSWNGDLGPRSAAGALYEVVRYTLVRRLLEPVLGKELANHLMGAGLPSWLTPVNEFYGHDTLALLRLLNKDDSWWIQQAGGRENLLRQSFQEAVRWLQKAQGADPSQWQWGKLHQVTFHHALGELCEGLNVGPFPVGGDTDTLCQMAMLPTAPYDANAVGPSFRQIVDLADLDHSLAIHGPGQSGQISSPHYNDLAPLWLKGKYHPMLWSRKAIERETESILNLTPQTRS